MASSPQSILAREGWPHVAIVGTAAVVVQMAAGGFWALPLWLLLAFVVQFFRDPPRSVPTTAGVVVSAADGKVVALGPAHDPYLDRQATKVSVFMNVFSVHANRAPISGTLVKRWYHPGRFLNAALDKASLANERSAIWLRSPQGHDVVSVQVAGLIARRILCYVSEGDRVDRGERYGFIRFGSRLDLYLPPDAELTARLGDWVKAGSDIIARLPDVTTVTDPAGPRG